MTIPSHARRNTRNTKIGVPHGILCNIAFKHGLEMSVDEVRVAARSLVAYEPVARR